MSFYFILINFYYFYCTKIQNIDDKNFKIVEVVSWNIFLLLFMTIYNNLYLLCT